MNDRKRDSFKIRCRGIIISCSEDTDRIAVCMSPTWPDQPSPAQNMVPTMALYHGATLKYWGWTARKHENEGRLQVVHVGRLIDSGISLISMFS